MAASLKNDDGCINLIDDDDDSPHLETSLIDLCYDDDDDTRKRKSIEKENRKKKSRIMTQTNQDDAVVVDGTTALVTEEEEYKRVVGPTRMGFIGGWVSAHSFGGVPPVHRLPKTLYSELLEYQLNLPIAKNSSVFIRVQESRLDLLRCMVTGPVGTPYSLGCFFFDISLKNYPGRPPSVKFLTTDSGRVRFNPNLYKCGKVCLSLLGTWSGPGWVAGVSTLLQVLISIQGLILVEQPYFNEPGYESTRHTAHGRKNSEQYSHQVRKHALRVAIAAPLAHVVRKNSMVVSPYPEFNQAVAAHFAQQENELRRQVADWSARDQSLHGLGLSVLRDLDTLLEQRRQKAEPETIEIL